MITVLNEGYNKTLDDWKSELDSLFDRNASDTELSDFIELASNEIEDNQDYSDLFAYFDTTYRQKYNNY